MLYTLLTRLIYSSSFHTISISIATNSSDYFLGQLFPFEIDAKEQSDFSTFFPLQLHTFHLSKLCVIYLLYYFFVMN